MKNEKELRDEIAAMANTFKFAILEDWQIESMLSQFALTVQLYQKMVRGVSKEDYKLSQKEYNLLKKIIK